MAKKNDPTIEIPLSDLASPHTVSRTGGTNLGLTSKYFNSELQLWIDNLVSKVAGLISDQQLELLCREITVRCQGNEPDINKALHYFNCKKLKRSIVIFNAMKDRISYVYTKDEDGTNLKWYWIRVYL